MHGHAKHRTAAGQAGAAVAPTPAARLWARISEHRVVQWLLAYTAFAYTTLHSVEMLSHTFEWPVTTMRITSDALMVGFPVTVALAWYHNARRTTTQEQPAAAAVAAAPHNSIAVLPFIDMSEQKDQEYFSDGLSEELIGLLTKIPALHVPARTSSFYFKGKQATIAEIAQALHVAHVLEGSVRKAGGTLRISVQLARADSGYHLWSETYDRKLDDIFKVQDEIAGAVVHALRVTLLDAQLPARPATTNSEAYQLYLRGRYHWNRRAAADFRKAVDYFTQAIARDGQYALAYSGLADCHGLLPIYDRSANAAELARQARQAALKALAIDASLAEAHASLGLVSSTLEYEWQTAGEHFRRAIELNARAAAPHQWYGMLLINTGAIEAGLGELRLALESDPLSLPANLCLGIGLNCARRHQEAVLQLQRTLELGKDFADTNFFIYEAHANQGQYPEAVAAYAYQKGLEGESAANLAAIRQAFAEGGWAGFLRHRIAAVEAQPHPVPEEVASFHARLGDADGAMPWLEKSFRRHSPRLALLKVDPRYDNLRGDARFDDLLARLGLAAG